MDYLCAKFDGLSFSRFIMRFIKQTDTRTESHTDAAKRFTPAPVVGLSNHEF